MELVEIELPEFGLPYIEPVIPAETYCQRIDEIRARAREVGYDVLVVYGDREHFANMAYLTGYDPRFEEGLLVLDINRQLAGGLSSSLVMRGSGMSR